MSLGHRGSDWWMDHPRRRAELWKRLSAGRAGKMDEGHHLAPMALVIFYASAVETVFEAFSDSYEGIGGARRRTLFSADRFDYGSIPCGIWGSISVWFYGRYCMLFQ